MKSIEGIVTIVQESRFQLLDDQGASHLVLLSHDAGAEPQQLGRLQERQARVRVRYSEPGAIIGLVAHSVELIDPPTSRAEEP